MNIVDLLRKINDIIGAGVPFLVGLAVLFFVYGIIGYIRNADNEEKRTEARLFILWGIIGIFVIASLWGLVNILVVSFGFSDNTSAIVKQTYSTTDKVSGTPPSTIVDLIDRINTIGTVAVLPFLFTIAFFILLYGIVNYVRQGDNEEKRAEGRMFIIWGIISIFIMLSVWGLVNILVKSFNFGDNKVPQLKSIFDNLNL